MKLLSVDRIPPNSRVILRMDLDVPISEGTVTDNSRLKKSLLTIKLLLERECLIIILGHRGRPEGRDESLSLRPVYAELMSILEEGGQDVVRSVFVDEVNNREKIAKAMESSSIIFMENLRFWAGEREGNDSFLGAVKEVSQYFVNDALATAHRKDASMMLGSKMSAFYGLSFVEEVEKWEKIRENPKRPLVIILGGAKKDKLDYLPELEKIADKVLIGGKLIAMVSEADLRKEKVVVGMLSETGLDVAEKSVARFKEELVGAKTVIWAGALGKFEEEAGRRATAEIANYLGSLEIDWVVAGGETMASLKNLESSRRIDVVITGGGVFLEYLTKGTLPTIEE
ncbi:phosphoglycerate kinase [Patescibacteria group bacterium]|nr:phosphoglycerate kinase [Patescibacteria group bacterium]